jgi:hypothetical protein
MEKMISQVMEKGKILDMIPNELELREYVKKQLEEKLEI